MRQAFGFGCGTHRVQSGQSRQLHAQDRLFPDQASQYQFGAQPVTQSPRSRGGSPFYWSKPSRVKSPRETPPRGASSGASILGISCLSFRSGGRCFGRWIRRFFERSLGRGSGMRNLNSWPRIFSAFARYLLSGAHAISRLSALWRRVQGDGARALRPRLVPRRHAEDCASASRRRLRARPEILPPSSRGHRLSVGGRVSGIRRFVFAGARATARAAAPAERIRSRIAIATSPARPRRCTRRRSFIFSTCCRSAPD